MKNWNIYFLLMSLSATALAGKQFRFTYQDGSGKVHRAKIVGIRVKKKAVPPQKQVRPPAPKELRFIEDWNGYMEAMSRHVDRLNIHRPMAKLNKNGTATLFSPSDHEASRFLAAVYYWHKSSHAALCQKLGFEDAVLDSVETRSIKRHQHKMRVKEVLADRKSVV